MKKEELDELLLKGNLNLLPATFLDSKDSRILSRSSSVMRGWADEELYPSLLLSLLRYPRQFKKIRSVGHLARLICAEGFYKKKIMNTIDQFPGRRHLFVKLLKTALEFPFGSKKVLGIVTTFNLMKEREAFEELHILEAIRRILPGTKGIKGSFLEYQDKQNQIETVYVEIEKEDQDDFSLEEKKRLQKTLPEEFKGCIEQLVPLTFMRRNEEEVYRNILQLRDQLKTTKDLPQATITFEEQTQFDLFFTVVLLRVVKGGESSLKELFEKHHPEAFFILDRVDMVGNIRKNYQKQATVFRLQLSKTPFFRKDRSVNLYKARRKVLSMLTKALGQVRDFNGGLILKQNERLDDFLALMPNEFDEFFLENFFYSITPIAMQSILPSSLVKEWFLAFSELMEKEASRKDVYLISCRTVDEATIVIVRAEDRSFKEDLLKEIHQIGIPSLELAFSEFHMFGNFSFGFLYRPSLSVKERDFCQLVRKTMKKWSEKNSKDQTLRIALHGNEPSLDPRIAKSDQSHIIIKMLFEGLVRIGQDGKPEMAIASKYEVTPDFKKYTFYLRESKWSNGMPVTAKDFEYSWKKSLNPHAGSFFSNTFYVIKNARLAHENKIDLDEVGIHALDDRTLVVELEYPAPHFLETTAHWTFSLINSAIDQKHPGWAYQADDTYVSNGPFKLFDWKHSRVITVEKNPSYWDAPSVKLQKIYITMMDNHQIDLKMFEKGAVDLVGKPLTSLPQGKLEKPDEADQITFPVSANYVLCFNAAQFPFNHKKIRQAFAYAIDRNALEKHLPYEFCEKSFSLLPKELSLQTEPLFHDRNLEKARALFKEGLGEIGFVKSDFPKLTVSFFSPNRAKLFKELVQQWKEAFHIDVYAKQEDWKAHFENLSSGNFQIGGLELHARWSDPLHLLEIYENKEDLMNLSSWEHVRFQELLRKAKKMKTVEERNEILKVAEALLAAEVPAIPLYDLKGSCLKKKDLKGIFTSKFSQVIDFKWSYRE